MFCEISHVFLLGTAVGAYIFQDLTIITDGNASDEIYKYYDLTEDIGR